MSRASIEMSSAILKFPKLASLTCDFSSQFESNSGAVFEQQLGCVSMFHVANVPACLDASRCHDNSHLQMSFCNKQHECHTQLHTKPRRHVLRTTVSVTDTSTQMNFDLLADVTVHWLAHRHNDKKRTSCRIAD